MRGEKEIETNENIKSQNGFEIKDKNTVYKVNLFFKRENAETIENKVKKMIKKRIIKDEI